MFNAYALPLVSATPETGRSFSASTPPNDDVLSLGYADRDEKSSNRTCDRPGARELGLWLRRIGGPAGHDDNYGCSGGSVASSLPSAPMAAVVARSFMRAPLRCVRLNPYCAYESRVLRFIRNTERTLFRGRRDSYGTPILVAWDISKQYVPVRICIGTLFDASCSSYCRSRISSASVARRGYFRSGKNHRGAGGTAQEASFGAIVVCVR